MSNTLTIRERIINKYTDNNGKFDSKIAKSTFRSLYKDTLKRSGNNKAEANRRFDGKVMREYRRLVSAGTIG